MKKTIAILWTITLCIDIACALNGMEANWFLVFCPLSTLCLKYWTEASIE